MDQAASEQAQTYDVVIVGAGMVGSAIACRLGQAGFSVAVLDRAEPQGFATDQMPDLRVSALSPSSLSLLKQVKAWSNIEAMRYAPYQRMAVWEKLNNPLTGEPIITSINRTEFHADELNEPFLGVIVENRVTQLALHQRIAELPSVDLILDAEITQMATEPHVAVALADGRLLTGELLVGADGANSIVKRWAEIETEEKPYEQHALVATVEYQGCQQDITWQGFTATGPEAFLPLPDIDGKHYGSLVWYNLPETIDGLKQLPDDAFMKKLQRSFPEELPELTKVLSRGSFPLVRRHAQSYYGDRLVIAGDAAHTINPLAGQGVNLGFQDVETLTRLLIQTRDKQQDFWSADVLAKYQQIRRPQNAMMMRVMDLFYHTFSNDVLPLKVARTVGLTVASRFTFGQKMVMKYAMGLANVWPENLPELPAIDELTRGALKDKLPFDLPNLPELTPKSLIDAPSQILEKIKGLTGR